MLKDRFASPCLAGPWPPPALEMVNRALHGGISWVGANPRGNEGPRFQAALRLGPCSPPPSTEELMEIASAVSAGGRLVLAFRSEPEDVLELPAAWRPRGGDLALIPGSGAFDPERRAKALANEAWRVGDEAIAVLLMERQP